MRGFRLAALVTFASVVLALPAAAQVMNFTTFSTGVSYPIHLARDGAGNIYESDTGSYTIRKCTPAGVCSLFAGTVGVQGIVEGPPGTGRFYRPTQVLANPDGSLLVGDVNGIRRVAPDGTLSTWIGWNSYPIIWVEALTRDSAGNVYASESSYRSTIAKITPDGVMTVFAGDSSPGYADGAGTSARFNYITEMTIDASDNIYLVDSNNSCLRKVTPAGVVSTIAGVGGDARIIDGAAGVNRVRFPYALARVGTDIYFTDQHTIRKLDAAGNVTTVAGKADVSGNRPGTGTSARFYYALSFLAYNSSTWFVGDDNMKLWKATPGLTDAAAIDQPTGTTTVQRQLSVVSATSGATYQWSVGSAPSGSTAPISGSGATATFTPDYGGPYALRLDASSSAGTSVTYADFAATCTAQSAAITVTPTSICAYQSGTAQVTNASAYVSMQWSIANGALDSDAAASSVSFHSTSTVPVQLTVNATDTFGCTVTTTYTVPMNGTTPVIQLDTPDICPFGDDAATIDASYIQPNWSSVNAEMTNGSYYSNRLTFRGDGSGLPPQLTVNATDPNTGCMVSNTITVPLRTLAKPVIQLDSPTMCAYGQNGASIDTTLYPPPPQSQYSQPGGYEWHITNGTIVDGQFASHVTFTQDGTANAVQLYVIYRSNDYCTTTSDVTPAPLRTLTPPTINLDSPDVCPNSGSFASVAGTYATYHWVLTHASITNGQYANHVDFIPDGTGDVVATVYVTDSTGCQATSAATIPLRVIGTPSITLDTPDVCPYGSDMASIAGSWAYVYWAAENGTITDGQGTSRITFSPSAGMPGQPTQPVQLSVHVSDGSYCQSNTTTITVPLRTITAPAITLDTPDVCPYGSDMASIPGTWQGIYWDVQNGYITGGQGTNSITFAPSAGGPGQPTQPVQLTVRVRDYWYCEATTSTVTVPLRTITAPAVTLATADVCPYGSDSASIPGTWQGIYWDVQNGYITGGQGTNTITFSPSAGGPGQPTQPVVLTVRVRDYSYCEATTSTVTVPLRTITAPAVTLATADVCPYGSDSASIPGTWQGIYWDIQNGYISGGQGTNTITFSPSAGAPGQPTQAVVLTVRVRDYSYCEATTSAVTVPLRTITAPAVTLGTPDVCPYGSDTASIPGTWQDIYWDVQNGYITGGQGTNTITFAPSAGGPGQPTQPVVLTVRVRDYSYCEATTSTVTVPIRTITAPTIALDVAVICPNGAPDSASITGTWSQMVSWTIVNGTITGGDGTNRIVFTANGSGPVQLTVRVTDADGCTATTDTVNVPLDTPQAAITASGGTTFCAGGSVTLTASAASSYLWSNGATTQSITVSTSGNYSVTVTGQGGCTSTSQPLTVTVNPLPPSTITASGPTTFCAGGSVTLTAPAGYSYLWSNGATSRSIVATQSGSYSVTVSDANCSSTSAPAAVTVNPAPVISSATAPQFVCWNGTGYTASVANDPNVTYSWTASSNAVVRGATNTNQLAFDVVIFSPSQTTIDLHLTATSASGCSTLQNFSIPISNPDATVTASGPTTFCKGGSVTLTAPAGYSCLWSNNATTQSITVSDSGAYRVTVTDANGCSKDSQWTTVTVNDPPKPTIYAYGPTSFCDGSSVQLTSTGPGPWLWSNGATAQSIIVSTAGSYTVTTTDSATQCGATSDPVVITTFAPPAAPSITFDKPQYCPEGSVTATAPAGYASYTWTYPQSVSVEGQGTNTLTLRYPGNAPSLTVGVTVTNASGCAATGAASIPLRVLPKPVITADASQICLGGTVHASTAVVQNVSYQWSVQNGTIVSGAGTPSITISANAGAGPLTINLYLGDTDLCSTYGDPVNVTVAPPPSTTVTASGPTALCAGGSVTLTAPAGMTAYAWSNGATTQAITVSAAGAYHVSVTDSNGCTATSSDTNVTVNGLPSASVTASGPTTFCAGGNVTLTAPAGMTSYAWNNGATTQSITVSTGGAYHVTVTNSSGCTATSSDTNVTVNALPSTTITASGPTTFCAGGNVRLTAPAGMTSYAWNNGATTQSITVSTGGAYRVTVTDTNSCSATSSDTNVTVNPLPSTTLTASGPTTFCAGGSVTLTAPAGMTSYAWNTGATTQSISVSTAGAYHVTITDANGCTAMSSDTNVTVNPLPSTTVTASGPTTFCAGGSVTLTAPAGMTSYAWNTGATTQSISVSTGGAYHVTVTDANGCTATSSDTNVTVNALPSTTVTASGPTTFCAGGSVTLTAPAGMTSYAWNNGATTQSITISTGGAYHVTVTNSNGCTATSSDTNVTVNALPGTTITASGPTTFCAGGSVTLTAPAGMTSYAWNNGATTQSISVSTGGAYHVTVTDANGCSATSSDTNVTVNALPSTTVTASGPTTFCAGGSVTLTAPAGMTSYAWNTGATTQSITISTGGAYHVTVTNANGCTATSADTSVAVNPLPDATITAPAAICTGTSGNASVPAITGGTYAWTITGGTITSSATANTVTFTATTGTVTLGVTVTNANNCTSTASKQVAVSAYPDATITAPASICSGQSATASVPAIAGATYAWTITGGTIDSGATTASVTFSSTGASVTLNATVTNASGCSSSSSKSATVKPVADDTITAPAILCAGASGTASVPATTGATYSWTITGGTITAGATTRSVTFTATTDPVVLTATVTASNGCPNSSSATVAVSALPDATITAPPSFCKGTSSTASVPAITGGTYTWTITNGTITAGAGTNAITYTSTNTSITLKVTVKNANGCSASSSSTITVTPTTSIQQPSNKSVKAGSTTTLSVNATGSNLTYAWYSGQYPNGTLVGTTATITVGPYATKGTYPFYVEVTGTCGTVHSNTVTLTVN